MIYRDAIFSAAYLTVGFVTAYGGFRAGVGLFLAHGLTVFGLGLLNHWYAVRNEKALP